MPSRADRRRGRRLLSITLPIVWVSATGGVAYFGHIDGVHAPPAFSIRRDPFATADFGWEIRWQPGWRLVGGCAVKTLDRAKAVAERWLLSAYFTALASPSVT